MINLVPSYRVGWLGGQGGLNMAQQPHGFILVASLHAKFHKNQKGIVIPLHLFQGGRVVGFVEIFPLAHFWAAAPVGDEVL